MSDRFQVLTLIFGVLVVSLVAVDYNDYQSGNRQLRQLLDALRTALFPAFAAYALIATSATGEQLRMYKNFILAVSAFAWITVIWGTTGTTSGNGADAVYTPATGWYPVTQKSAYSLLQGSLIALPLIWFDRA